jgi:hypothetical protein
MVLVVINCYVLYVFLLMISVPLYTEYYIPLLDVTLIIRYMLWDVYRILDEQHVVAPL